MFGRWITGLIVVALAVGVWALWPRDDTNSTTTTSVQAAPTTSTTDPTTTTSTATTTTGPNQETDIIETVAEAEKVLRELWFGWFEGIYNQDEDRIREVVASQSQLDAAIAAFDVATFTEEPSPAAILLSDIEILRADNSCTAVWANLDVSGFRGPGAETEGVHILRWSDSRWKSVATWIHRDDLWEGDCEGQLEPLS
ncbi:MAG: hypothetical protein WEF28_04725 [Acidimicrobiia bacterium]